MRPTLADYCRAALNLIFALAQPLISMAALFRGFRTSPVPYPQNLPTPIEPAGYAFAIWSVIYAGSIAFAALQCLPRNLASARFRDVGWYTGATFFLCCVWLLVASNGPVFLTAPIIAAMLACLFAGLTRSRDADGWAYWLVTAPLTLYAGWLSVATFANLQEALAGYGVALIVQAPAIWAMVMIAAAAVVAVLGLAVSRADLVYAAAVLWALIAIVIANVTRSPSVAGVAGAAAVLLVAVLMFMRLGQRTFR